MIDRKLVLYVLIGMISFAIWTAWQKDYGQNNIADNPSAIIAKKEDKKLVQGGKELLFSRETKTQEVQLIKVHTDVLDVVINTIGGNIIRANLLKYPEVIKQDNNPVKLLSDDSDRYYAVKSGLIMGDQNAGIAQEKYTASQKEYTLHTGSDSCEVKLSAINSRGAVITKTFIFKRGKYDIAVKYDVDNRTNKDWSGRFYAQIDRKDFGTQKGLFQFNTYTGASVSSVEKPYEKISFSNIADAAKENKKFIRDNQGGWVAMQQRYFLSVWVPDQTKTYKYFSDFNNGIYSIGFSDNDVVVPAGQKKTITSTLYVGPEITENLAPLAAGLDHTVDYGWLWAISIIFFWILKKIYFVVGNWGVAIILVTLLIKIAFYKLSESSCRSMARMRDLMPKMQALKERYADDKQKLQQATMELYKREKINPLNLGGCLPMLIQIPFFIALYYVLIAAVELRHAPFMFWIHDLSAHDPYYILPILMGGSMFLQQKLSPTSADPAQAKMMMFMPVIFTVFFLNFPSGLVLYWFVSNSLSILQQWYINKKISGCKIK